MGFREVPEGRLNMVVEVAKQLIQTAPHVAYGTEELGQVICEAYHDVLDKATTAQLAGRRPDVPHFANVLPVIEALGALHISRDEDARNKRAAYCGTDRFSIVHVDERDESPLSGERKPLSEWDGLQLAKCAELVLDAIHDDLEPEVTEAEAIMFAVGAIFGGPDDATDDVTGTDTSAYDLPFPDDLTPEDISMVAEALVAVDDLDEVTDITTMRQFLIAKKAYQMGAEDGRKDVQVVAAPIVEPVVESTDVSYVTGFKAGYRDGFADGRNW